VLVRVALVLSVLSLACGASEDVPVAPPALPCVAGELQLPDGSCRPAGLPPDLPCPPGTLADARGTCLAAGVPPDACAEGFTHDGDASCLPVLPPAPCPFGTMAVPGERACHPVAPCGSPPWGETPVEPSTEYVDLSYAGGNSDGSSAKPWTTIQAGVDAAEPGAIVAVTDGTYVEDVLVSGKAVRIWGRCPDVVALAGTGARFAALDARATGTEAHRLAITGAGIGVLVLGATDVVLDELWIHGEGHGVHLENDFGPASATVSRSLIELAGDLAAYAQGSAVSVESSVLRDTQTVTSVGYGISVEAGIQVPGRAMLEVRGSLIERNRGVGIEVRASDATIEGTVVRDGIAAADGHLGLAVLALARPAGRPHLDVDASYFSNNRDATLVLSGADATVRNTVIVDTQSNGDGDFGRGMSIEGRVVVDGAPAEQAEVTVTHVTIERSHDTAIYVGGAHARIEGTLVRETQPAPRGLAPAGITVFEAPDTGDPSRADIVGSVLAASDDGGLFVSGSEARLETSVVADTRPRTLEFAIGVIAQAHDPSGAPSSVEMVSSLIADTQGIGLFVSSSSAMAETSVIRRTTGAGPLQVARGAHVQAFGPPGPLELHLTGVVIEDTHEFGLSALDGNAVLEACIVRNTTPTGTGTFGDGVVVQRQIGEGSVALWRTLVQGNARAGLVSFGSHASLAGSSFVCQPIAIDAEDYYGFTPSLDDQGENLCGCPVADGPCKAVSAALAPPGPLDDPPSP
jgi:hypothetical protein